MIHTTLIKCGRAVHHWIVKLDDFMQRITFFFIYIVHMCIPYIVISFQRQSRLFFLFCKLFCRIWYRTLYEMMSNTSVNAFVLFHMIIFSNYTYSKCLRRLFFGYICLTLFSSSIYLPNFFYLSLSDCIYIPKNCLLCSTQQTEYMKQTSKVLLAKFSYCYLLFNKHFGVCQLLLYHIFRLNESTPHRIFNELKNTPIFVWVRVCVRVWVSAHRCVLAFIIFPSFAHLSIYLSQCLKICVVSEQK